MTHSIIDLRIVGAVLNLASEPSRRHVTVSTFVVLVVFVPFCVSAPTILFTSAIPEHDIPVTTQPL